MERPMPVSKRPPKELESMAELESIADALVRWERVLADGTFEESLDAVEEIAAQLEQGRLGLDDALRCYEAGVLLARRCEKIIAEAELRISRLDQSEVDAFPDDIDEE
jgi:exodeoxyribonuclease VII small subunit